MAVAELSGRWVPTNGSGEGEAFIEFDDSGDFAASDGCNGVFGTWSLGDRGTFSGTREISSQIACDNWEGPNWMATADFVGMLENELAFYDANGALLGTMSPA